MAGSSTPQMRGWVWLVLLALAGAAWAGPGYVKIDDSKIVFLRSKIVLVHTVGWQAQNEAAFKAWAKEQKLPEDPGALVEALPAADEFPIAAHIYVDSDKPAVTFEVGSETPVVVALETVPKGYAPAKASEEPFKAVVKRIGLQPSTLLTVLAGKNDLQAPEAWAMLISRVKKSPEFFLPSGKQALWVSAKPKETTTGETSGITTGSTPDTRKTDTEKKSTSDGLPWTWIIGGVLVTALIALLAIPSTRRFFIRTTPGGAAGQGSKGGYKVSAAERELLELVREEQLKPRRGNVDNVSIEDVVIGKVMDAYRQHDKLVKDAKKLTEEVGRLEQYKAFASQAQAHSSAVTERDDQIRRHLEEVRKKVTEIQGLQSELKKAKDKNEELLAEQTRSDLQFKEIAKWIQELEERIDATLSESKHE